MNNPKFNQSVSTVSKFSPSGTLKKKQVLTPIKDGRLARMDFKNPYDDISAESYSIKSQLANGGNLQQVPRMKLEGVHGSDKVRAAADKMMSNSKSE